MAETKMQKVENASPDPARRDLLMQVLGAARYIEWWQSQSGSHLIQMLMEVEESKTYLDAGYPSFKEFLADTGLKTAPTYYRHRELFLKEGAGFDRLDLLGVPHALRRQLKPGQISFDGEDMIIEGQGRISLNNNGGLIRPIIEDLAKSNRAAEKELEKAAKKVKTLEGYKKGYDELKARETIKDPYMFAYSNLVEALKIYIEQVKDMSGPLGSLGGYEVAERAICDFPTIYILLEQLHDVAGEPMPWIRGSWNRQRHFSKEQIAKWPHFQSDAIDGDNF